MPTRCCVHDTCMQHVHATVQMPIQRELSAVSARPARCRCSHRRVAAASKDRSEKLLPVVLDDEVTQVGHQVDLCLRVRREARGAREQVLRDRCEVGEIPHVSARPDGLVLASRAPHARCPRAGHVQIAGLPLRQLVGGLLVRARLTGLREIDDRESAEPLLALVVVAGRAVERVGLHLAIFESRHERRALMVELGEVAHDAIQLLGLQNVVHREHPSTRLVLLVIRDVHEPEQRDEGRVEGRLALRVVKAL
mmetsp:Transcript_14747/g.42263  ORF Transcript_14747/g.42263 Transcript_14747/m.42263 type:complete len:252 (-) Transcript_14747:1607-2362(-)